MSDHAVKRKGASKPTSRYPDYHDRMDQSDEWIEQQRQELREVPGGAKKKFPLHLYRMLQAVDGTDWSLIVRWLPHGRAFVVLDKTRFENEVLPLYFPQQSSYASFQRQLNIYGFLRQTRDDDGYYHELFLRSRSTMVSIIPRPSQGRSALRQKFDPTSEPNFYEMPFLPDVTHPLDETPSHRRTMLPSSQLPRPARPNAASASAFAAHYAATHVGLATDAVDNLSHVHATPATQVAQEHEAFISLEPSTLIAMANVANTVPDLQHRQGTSPSIAPDLTGLPWPESSDMRSNTRPQRRHAHEVMTETGAFEADDMETICPESPSQRRATKLAEWADFLEDINFDSSSSSSGEQKKQPID